MKKSMTLFLALSLLAVGCLNDIEEAPLELVGTELTAPEGLTASISDGMVDLEWQSVSGASMYRLYRAAEQPINPTRIAETADTFYTDTNLINGRTYYYSVSAVATGPIEGPPSDQIPAVPSVYSIMINGGSEVTGSRSVTLEMTGPATTTLMKIGNALDLEGAIAGAIWESFYTARNWLLEEGDGSKTVYAQFQDVGGDLPNYERSNKTRHLCRDNEHRDIGDDFHHARLDPALHHERHRRRDGRGCLGEDRGFLVTDPPVRRRKRR